MKDSDLTKIKYGSPAFTKAWWEERRSFFARGSGVGKALDVWQKACKTPPKSMHAEGLAAATEACNELRSALLVAKKKVGKKDEATLKAIGLYLDVVDDFSNQINAIESKKGGMFDPEMEMIDAMKKFLPRLKVGAEKCAVLEKVFTKKAELYEKWVKEGEKKLFGSEELEKRRTQIEEEELDVSKNMKAFTEINKSIISPWKELRARITKLGLDDNAKIKAMLRIANGQYDIYVDAFGKAQDLGQDHLDLLRRMIKAMSGKAETLDDVQDSLKKLLQQIGDKTFGCGAKIQQQEEAIKEVRGGLNPVVSALKAKVTLNKDQVDTVLDLETRAQQIDAIAQANVRALLRAEAHVTGYDKKHGDKKELVGLLKELKAEIANGKKSFQNHAKFLKEVLGIIKLVKSQK